MDYATPGLSSPLQTLGLPLDADPAQIRARYLELVKQYPPEQDPERFREIRQAYDAIENPLKTAAALMTAPDSGEIPEWSAVLQQQQQKPPILSAALLLSLGNQE
jgi:curved DNA-binding protein CbpA